MNEILLELESIPWGLIAPLVIIQLILLVVALVDCFRHNNTNGPQWVWVLVIVFGGIIGPIVYFIFGRRND
ncbi:PLD nuclease N-terminal domain-containing protein [Evansella sp. AB-P1]|uniref:PLD nuclease N-terminal domain-containing protein n=1 Tax=Evansella sp. AB-P1 TaxID=3037653 RepID=UPI00241FA016|nr:PLD nuclease N-terminal domain-containing protein [Evansella sp. AB-P1]MDG5790084.1 PLD nuclease N-terminal domain-containing protein [Evansella sp. AB-P1]